MATITAEVILGILPHRYPMLLVDRILDYQPNAYIVGIKNVTFNEPFFQGHFPGHPVMPGVLQIEAMAQVAGILLNRSNNRQGQIAYFISVDNARFRRLVCPGDQLRIEIKVVKMRLSMYKVHGAGTVDGEAACEAEMMFARKPEK